MANRQMGLPMFQEERLIPERLVGNYKVNFMKGALCRKCEGMKQNIETMLQVNKWGKNQIEWMDDIDCKEAVERIHSKQLRETMEKVGLGEWKSDICRLAQLAVKGGYYTDNDMKAVQDVHEYIPAHTSFVSVVGGNEKYELFNSFIGVAPGHPIIYKAMNLTLEHYHNKKFNRLEDSKVAIHLGPFMLGKAYKWWAGQSSDEKEKIVPGEFFHESRPAGFQYSYLMFETPGTVSNAVLDPKTHTKVFQSRIDSLSFARDS